MFNLTLTPSTVLMIGTTSVIFILLFTLFICMFLSKIQPNNIFWCRYFFWHRAPKEQMFDGASNYGRCPRCNKRVLQDSQGNWYEPGIIDTE